MRRRTLKSGAPLCLVAHVAATATMAASFAICTFVSTDANAAATIDLPTPPSPNVMLLIDTSGSMEDWPDATLNNCGTQTTASTTDTVCSTTAGPNKWGAVIAALGGSFPTSPTTTGQYSYFEMIRKANSAFDNEYTLNGSTNASAHIYDAGYSLNFHRPLAWDSTNSTWCAIGPATLPGATGTGGVFRGAAVGDTADGADAYSTAFLAGLTPTNIEAYTAGADGVLNKCTYAQNKDGSIDSARDLVRFGLMTFDSDTAQGTGVDTKTTAPMYTVTSTTPWAGLWSYYPGWNYLTAPSPSWPTALGPYADTANTAALMSPYSTSPTLYSVGTAQPVDSWSSGDSGTTSLAGCICPSTGCPWEVGARNPAAPPWEGRMVQFPDGRAPLSAQESTNDEVKTVLAASRPYGATPIAGMLEDSRNYFRYDPGGPEKTDPYVFSTAGGSHGCRPQYQILLTDGSANLDLRNPTSAATGTSFASCEPRLDGKSSCPFQRPEDIATDMSTGNSGSFAPVTTFVIGFGIETLSASAAGVCKDFVTTNGGQTGANNVCAQVGAQATPGAGTTTAPTGKCAAVTPGSPLDACCNLIKIACAGTNNNSFYTGGQIGPYFADSAADLNGAFASILGSIARNASSHVVPVFATAVSANAKSAFASSYTTSSTGPWTGEILRTTTTCPAVTTTEDYAADLSTETVGGKRLFFTATASGTGVLDHTISLRPFLPSSTTDGLSSISASEKALTSGSGFNGDFSTSELPITAAQCPADPTTGATLDASHCRQYVLDFYTGSGLAASTSTTGQVAGKSGGTTYATVNRALAPLGPIIDSTPGYSARPNGASSDASYRQFVDSFSKTASGVTTFTRPNVLYVESTDGALHAFDADYGSAAATTALDPQIELWTFLPPAVISSTPQNLPSASKLLLDGSPIVADTIWSRTSTITGGASDWHTTLVSGFGAAGPGYFALDVTQPSTVGDSKPPSAGTYASPTGPHFLWQLTTVDSNHSALQLFAGHSVTPAITTLFINGAEVGVAVLPGGSDGQAPTGTCLRETTAATNQVDPVNLSTAIPAWAPRKYARTWSAPSKTTTNCSDASPVSGRSVTIVRLDTGAVVATFINPGDYTALKSQTSATGSLTALAVNFDSPLTGTPVVYPAGLGKIGRAVYISDADGFLWKLDVSDPSPSNWKGGLFFDAMNQQVMKPSSVTVNGVTESADQVAADVSQPFTGPPILSLGRTGNLVINFATGDQQLFTTKAFRAGSNDTVADELPEWNFVWSVSDVSTGPLVNWYVPFLPTVTNDFNDAPTTNTTCAKSDTSCTVTTTPTYTTGNVGERVTGPMSLFDGVLYFATLKPADDSTNTAACTAAESRIYGMDYEKPDLIDPPASGGTASTPGTCPSHGESNGTSLGCGGARRLPALATATATTTGSGLPQYTRPGDPGQVDANGNAINLQGTLIPGVAITQTQSCFSTGTGPDNYFGNPSSSYQSLSTPQQPMLTYLATAQASSLKNSVATTTPRTAKVAPATRATSVNSWAAVID